MIDHTTRINNLHSFDKTKQVSGRQVIFYKTYDFYIIL